MTDGFRFPLNIYGQTDVGGKRQRNEDSLRFYLPKPGEAEFRLGAMALVCDGMGGVGKGDIASQTAVEAIFRVYYDMDDPETDPRARLQKGIETAQKAVHERAHEFGMMYIGTTAAGMVIRPDGSAIIFNLGDSRVYRKRGDNFEVVSKDQSVLAAQLERGEITPEQAIASRNMNITAFIGHPLELSIIFRDIRVEEGDVFLLCSDGLWDVVHDPELKAALDTRSDEAALHYFIAETLKRGAPDNVTAIIVSTRSPKRAGIPAWIWGLVGLLGLAIAAFLVMRGSVNTLTGETSTPDNPTEVAAISPSASAESALMIESATPSHTPTKTVTFTKTPRPTLTDTPTETAIPSETPIPSVSPTHLNTATRRPSRTPSHTPAPTDTPTETPTPSDTPTRLPTATHTPSYTPTPSRTPSSTPPPSDTPTVPPTITARPSLTSRPTRTPTSTPTVRPSRTPVPIDNIAATSTLNASSLTVLGTPESALKLIKIVPLSFRLDAAVPFIEVYMGDLTEVNALPFTPVNNPGFILQLVRLRPGVIGNATTTYYYRLDPVEPQFLILGEDGIVLRALDSFESATTGSIGVGDTARVLGITPNGEWFLAEANNRRGWVSRSLLELGLVRFLGDLSTVPVFRPQPLPPTLDANATAEITPVDPVDPLNPQPTQPPPPTQEPPPIQTAAPRPSAAPP